LLLLKAQTKNLNELVEMNTQLVVDEQFDVVLSPSEMIARMETFIIGSIYDCYLLMNNDEICVGYCLVDTTKKPIYLRHLFIKEQYRGKGFGKETIKTLLGTYNTTQLDIEVMAWNDKAITFYNKIGFKCRYHGMRISQEKGN